MGKDLEYLRSLKMYVLAATGIFILSIIIGFIVSLNNPGFAENYLEMLKKSLGWIKTLDPLLIMPVIFLNNAFRSFLALVLGMGFGIIPVLFVAVNGIVLGIVADATSRQQGVLYLLAATVPHGIIELPMILVSAGIGLRLGQGVYMYLKGVKKDLKLELKQGVGFYLRRILPMLFLAAFIETFVTPFIILLTH